MAKKQPYTIIVDPEVMEHFRAIPRKEHSRIRSAILEQLEHEPDVVTRNRKLLRQPAPFDANWELRVGMFRVLYDINQDDLEVIILAVGEKRGNVFFFGGEEWQP